MEKLLQENNKGFFHQFYVCILSMQVAIFDLIKQHCPSCPILGSLKSWFTSQTSNVWNLWKPLIVIKNEILLGGLNFYVFSVNYTNGMTKLQ